MANVLDDAHDATPDDVATAKSVSWKWWRDQAERHGVDGEDAAAVARFSSAHTRSQTMAAALERMGLPNPAFAPPGATTCRGVPCVELRVRVLGAEGIEGRDAADVAGVYAHLLRHLAAIPHCCAHLRLLHIGPHSPCHEPTPCRLPGVAAHVATGHSDHSVSFVRGTEARWVSSHSDGREAGSGGGGRAVRVVSRCVCGAGDGAACTGAASDAGEAAELAFAFNAGVWGYPGWPPSLSTLRCPIVISAYNYNESDHDCDTLWMSAAQLAGEAPVPPEAGSEAERGWIRRGAWMWAPEPNVARSLEERKRKDASGVVLSDNAAWQAVWPGERRGADAAAACRVCAE